MSLLRHNNMVILLPRIQYGPVSAKSVQEIRVCINNCCFVPALLRKPALCLHLIGMDLGDMQRCFAVLEYSFQSSIPMSFALVLVLFHKDVHACKLSFIFLKIDS